MAKSGRLAIILIRIQSTKFAKTLPAAVNSVDTLTVLYTVWYQLQYLLLCDKVLKCFIDFPHYSSCFHTCTGLLNFSRHYLGGQHVRTQMHESVSSEISPLVQNLFNVQLSPCMTTAGNSMEYSQCLTLANVFISADVNATQRL